MIRRCFYAICLLMLGLQMSPAAMADATLPPDQKKAFEQLIHDYLLSHPEVLNEALATLKAEDDAKAAAAAHDALVAHRDALLNDPQSPVGGNPKGDVTLVEFFDYRCPYCKQMQPSLEALLKDDPKLRIVYKEFPILGQPSVVATQVALAARKQGKYDEFHRVMMNTKGQIDDQVIVRVAQSVGLDMDKIKADMAAPEVASVIKSDFELAKALNVRATPVFVVGDEILPGAIDIDMLKGLIANLRAAHS